MANENNAVADFLGETPEPQDIFTEAPIAEEPIEEKEEKPLRFDKDPKVQRYIEKQVEKALKNKAPIAEESPKREGDVKIPSSLVNLIGNDTPEKQQVLKDFAEHLQSLKGEARQEFLSEMKAQEQAKIQADNAAIEEFNSGLEEIEDTFGIDLTSNTAQSKQLKAQFVDYVRKVAPKDANGEVAMFPDLVASFEEFQEKNKRPASRAKELATRGLTRSGDTSNAPVTGKSWKDVERYFEKLKTN